MRFRLRTLFVLITIVAAFFAGRASTAPQMKALEQRLTDQDRQMTRLEREAEMWKYTYDSEQKASAKRRGVTLPPVIEAERGVYLLGPGND